VPVRHTEDYGYLRARDAQATAALWPWAPLKYIPLNDTGDTYLTLGSEFRLRYERYENNNWGEGPQDNDGYFWARALPLADLHVGDNVRFFGQLITAYVFGLDVPQTPVDEDRLDLLQGFADVRLPLAEACGPALTLRLGRQLMTYGSGRLIDIRYGPNVLQSFDAAKVFVESDRVRLDAFYARPVHVRADEFDDRADDHQALWSLYGTLKPQPSAPAAVDLYYIGYLNEEAVFADRTGRELRHTLGARLFGEAGGWDWNFEFIYQFGDFDAGAISAWGVGSDTGYTFQDAPLTPRVALRAAVISGDRDPGDRDVQTFNPLFPRGRYFGELSPVGPANLIRVNPYVVLRPMEKLRLTGNVAFFWRESLNDGIYPPGSMNLLRGDSASDARYIGTQVELLLEYEIDRHLTLSASYSVFTAGAFIEDTGSDQAIQLAAVELLYRF
jgi:hypothetical protein